MVAQIHIAIQLRLVASRHHLVQHSINIPYRVAQQLRSLTDRQQVQEQSPRGVTTLEMEVHRQFKIHRILIQQMEITSRV